MADHYNARFNHRLAYDTADSLRKLISSVTMAHQLSDDDWESLKGLSDSMYAERRRIEQIERELFPMKHIDTKSRIK